LWPWPSTGRVSGNGISSVSRMCVCVTKNTRRHCKKRIRNLQRHTPEIQLIKFLILRFVIRINPFRILLYELFISELIYVLETTYSGNNNARKSSFTIKSIIIGS
jgi:hypothetical protein